MLPVRESSEKLLRIRRRTSRQTVNVFHAPAGFFQDLAQEIAGEPAQVPRVREPGGNRIEPSGHQISDQRKMAHVRNTGDEPCSRLRQTPGEAEGPHGVFQMLEDVGKQKGVKASVFPPESLQALQGIRGQDAIEAAGGDPGRPWVVFDPDHPPTGRSSSPGRPGTAGGTADIAQVPGGARQKLDQLRPRMVRRFLEKEGAERGIRRLRRGFTSNAARVGCQGFVRDGRQGCRVEENRQPRRRGGSFADGRKTGPLQLPQCMNRRQVLHPNAQRRKHTAGSELRNLRDRLGDSGFLFDEDTDRRSGEDRGGRSPLVGGVFGRLAEPSLPTQPRESAPETSRSRWFSGEEENRPRHARAAPAGTLGAVRSGAESAAAATRDQVCRGRSMPTV